MCKFQNIEIYKFWLLFACFLPQLACQKNDAQQPLTGYLQFAADQAKGLLHRRAIEDFVLSVMYLPREFEAAKAAARGEGRLSELAKDYTGHQYFLMKIEAKDPLQNFDKLLRKRLGDEAFAKAQQELEFRLTPKFGLQIGSDTLPCALYHAFPSPLKSGGYQFEIIFQNPSDAPPIPQDEIFLFEDDFLFKQKHSFQFLGKDIQNAPKIR